MSEQFQKSPGSGERDSNHITLEDGRRLAYKKWGRHDGLTVFDFHGSPSSRHNLAIRGFRLGVVGVQMVSFDRPGYGESDSHPGRTVADTANDVRQLAEALNVARFSLLARSGGVPHALGCAALLSEQVASMACMASVAPRAMVARWDDGMTSYNQERHSTALVDPAALAQQYDDYAAAAKNDKNAILDLIGPDLPANDEYLLTNAILRTMVAKSHAEGLRSGGTGWTEDTIAVNSEWGFDVADIRCPTVLLHGAKDPFVSTQHTRVLRDVIPDAASVVYPDFGHFGGMAVIEKVITYLKSTNLTGKNLTRDELRYLFAFQIMYEDPIIPEVKINSID